MALSYTKGVADTPLLGGMPKMVDARGTSTVGPGGLTYYANDDRLLVTSDSAKPGQTRINRKKGK